VKTPASAWVCSCALALHAALILGLAIWCGWKAGIVIAAPLIVSAFGLLRERTYTAAWASLCLCFYIGGFLVEAYASPPHRVVALRMSILATLDFTALLLFVRWRVRERRDVAARKVPSGDAGC
jgi:uncharacterized membrane protein